LIAAGAILVAVMKLASCYQDRNDERVPDHLARIAYAIGAEARTPEEAAALVTIGKFEGGFCIAVQDHYTHSGGWSTFQLEGKNNKYPGPLVGLSYESIRRATYAAADVWRHSHQCGQSPWAMFTAYAGRPYCSFYIDKNGNTVTTWPTLDARVNTYWYVLSIIKKEMNNEQQRKQ